MNLSLIVIALNLPVFIVAVWRGDVMTAVQSFTLVTSWVVIYCQDRRIRELENRKGGIL